MTIQKETHFTDLIDTQHMVDDEERLPGRDGTPGTGMKLSEAVLLAQSWWDTKARMMMPDFGKPAEQQVIKSGIMMGLPWFNLGRQEMLRVVSQWYANVGVNLIIDGRSTSDDTHANKNIADLRDDGAGIMPILSDEGTHAKTSPTTEVEEWTEGYKEIENEERIIV